MLGTDLNTPQQTYDITSTLLGSEITADTEGSNRYLQLTGANEIDKYFTEAVKSFETQLMEQQLAAQKEAELQADIAYQKQANIAAETSTGLSTGAQAVQASQFEQARQATSEQITQNIQEQIDTARTEFNNALNQEYSQIVSSIQSTLEEYQEIADYATQGVLGLIAVGMGKTEGKDTYEYLQSQGILQPVLNIDGTIDYELTDTGYNLVDQLLNGLDPMSLGFSEVATKQDVISKIAEQSAIAQYGEDVWSTMTDSAKEKAKKQYADWLYETNNISMLKATHLGLAEYDDNGNLIIDTFWSEDLPSDYTGILGIAETEDERTSFSILSEDARNFRGPDEATIAEDVTNGKIINGSYLLKDNTYYLYYNNMIYKTNITTNAKNIKIPANSVTTASFGKFLGSDNPDSKQTLYVQALIDAANNSKIPDGTYVNMNYGLGVRHIWQYSNNNWIYIGDVSTIGKNTKNETVAAIGFEVNALTIPVDEIIDNNNAKRKLGIIW